MKNILCMVSGGGTNLKAILKACDDNIIKSGKVTKVISSKHNVKALEIASSYNIENKVVCAKDYAKKDEYYIALDAEIDRAKADLIVLAGYLSILPEIIINKHQNKIINVHPSLIPSFCGDGFYGLKVHEEALKKGVKVSGATVHFVNEIVDGGAIIAQKAVAVQNDDTAESLQLRIMQECEWILLPQVIEAFCSDKIAIDGNKAQILG